MIFKSAGFYHCVAKNVLIERLNQKNKFSLTGLTNDTDLSIIFVNDTDLFLFV